MWDQLGNFLDSQGKISLYFYLCIATFCFFVFTIKDIIQSYFKYKKDFEEYILGAKSSPPKYPFDGLLELLGVVLMASMFWPFVFVSKGFAYFWQGILWLLELPIRRIERKLIKKYRAIVATHHDESARELLNKIDDGKEN